MLVLNSFLFDGLTNLELSISREIIGQNTNVDINESQIRLTAQYMYYYFGREYQLSANYTWVEFWIVIFIGIRDFLYAKDKFNYII